MSSHAEIVPVCGWGRLAALSGCLRGNMPGQSAPVLPWIGAYDLFAVSNAVEIMLRVVIQVVTLSVRAKEPDEVGPETEPGFCLL
ncbi:hypothetical protein CFBP3846_02236 [Pseudomonas syringae pv. avii]|uniref:Secreted protein n=1 Tax=Pseudomonas syringae pv. avii TaxID=663959 RepID=A0ABY1U5U2_PSESX|nr:hypothetical protein AL046_01915 [Pseudomonas syringae pv. avii]POQ08882.1 hypothetical protein CXB40_07250 [Pseudomonas syringae pv. avii]SOS26656.1 hypothetical protein CFBP3846_02236 [Pseudomonas syringae pv. avii]